MTLLAMGRPESALGCGIEKAAPFYLSSLDEIGINFSQLYTLLPAMAAIKVWAEASLLVAADEEQIAYVKAALADVAETETTIKA